MAKPHSGQFARHEWAILGTTCGNVRTLATALAEHLSPDLKIGFADADHHSAEGASGLPFALEYTDKINFHRFDSHATVSPWRFRTTFNDVDLALINGNHFVASRQLLALDPKKMDSLARKTERLAAIDAFLILPESPAELPDFLKNQLPDWQKVPVFRLADTEAIAQFLKSKIAAPPLQGLVLAGGRSQRMGRDKGLIAWHGMPQRTYMARLLESLDVPTWFSCRPDQTSEFAENQRVIADTFAELGPFGAILSAFREQPQAAWLVVACDLPLLDAATLRFLIQNRKTSALATAFRSPSSPEGFPEPLITIWESKAYLHLLQFLAQGVSCPRKVLINSDAFLLDAPVPAALTNVNTPDDARVMNFEVPKQA